MSQCANEPNAQHSTKNRIERAIEDILGGIWSPRGDDSMYGDRMPIDYSNYPKDWKAIRARILERAGMQCECRGECGRHRGRCAARQYQPHPDTRSRVVLTIAHLNHNVGDSRDDNLRAMCQRCHISYDARLHARHARQTRARKRGQLMFNLGE